MTVTHKELDAGMSLFLELIQGDPSLDAYIEDARQEYFPGEAGFAGDPRSAPAAEVRFLEWVLFERDFEGGLLVERLLPFWRESAGPELSPYESTFLGTSAGIFEVGEEAAPGLYWLKDVAGFGEFAVEVRVADGPPQLGDLIVGRIFPTGDSVHVLSPGAGCFRDSGLIAAVHRDLEQARRDRTHQALRVRQEDLEAMFWGDALGDDAPDPVGDLRGFLTVGGLGSDEVDGFIDALSKRPVPTDNSGPFFLSAIQDLLDHLAFDTQVDLNLAQKKVLACWIHLQSGGKEGPAQSKSDEMSMTPEEALKAFDEDRASGLDAENAIARLSERLGLGSEAAGEEASIDSHTPHGLVDGLIEEYLWDLGRTNDIKGEEHRAVIELIRLELRHIETIEDLTPRRLLLFACTTLMEQEGFEPGQAQAQVQAVNNFTTWCIEHHGHLESEAVSEAFASLAASGERVFALNEHLKAHVEGGAWLQVESSGGLWEGVSSSGGRYELVASDELIADLEPGDFIRANLSAAKAEPIWVYPPELSAAQ